MRRFLCRRSTAQETLPIGQYIQDLYSVDKTLIAIINKTEMEILRVTKLGSNKHVARRRLMLKKHKQLIEERRNGILARILQLESLHVNNIQLDALRGVSKAFRNASDSFGDVDALLDRLEDFKEDFEEISEHRRPPRKGEHVSILDAALVESGLALHFLRKLIPGQEITWSIIDGRRPQIHHSEPINFENKQQRMLVQATGRIVKLVHSELSLDTISHLVDASREYGFGKLTLRVALEPQLQPKIQGSLDRQLSSKGGAHVGFVAKQPHDSMLLLCLETQ